MIADVADGPLLFARYAFMPNQLGYCGSDDNRALFEHTVSGTSDGGLIQLERQFEGAFPYLQLIALANGIADPLDRRVVEAYWLGNDLLDRVDMGLLYESLRTRFAGKLTRKVWPELASKVPSGARPHHSFHVFEIYPRAGTMKGGVVDHLFETMEQCRIRWGRVREVLGPDLLVDIRPLRYADGKLTLAAPALERVRRQFEGKGFTDDAAVGDWVSVHWGWACDLLSPIQVMRLATYTTRHITLCNDTL